MSNGSTFTPQLTLALPVSDRRASARWYETHLGCRLLYDLEEMGWCELSTAVPGVTLGLSDGHPLTPGGISPTWGVHDLDAVRATMEAAGVAFEGTTEVIEGFVKLATFADLDGNRVMLAQDLQGGSA